jgi:copper chaperone CopZ
MKTYKLYTSIKCAACVEKINKRIESFPQILSFKADLEDEKKTVTVQVTDDFSERKVKEVLKELGYYAITPKKSFFEKLFGI